jgi:thymidine kinase
MSRSGKLELILGPMYSGKTTELIRRINRLKVTGKQCVVIKYTGDNRYSDRNETVTHDSATYPATTTLRLSRVQLGDHLDAIGIDEGQFFEDLVYFCRMQVSRGLTVIVSALDGTFEQKSFGKVYELIPFCDSAVKLTAVCMDCGQAEAPFTRRLGSETEVKLIGGSEKYHAVCRSCYDAAAAVAAVAATAATAVAASVDKSAIAAAAAATTKKKKKKKEKKVKCTESSEGTNTNAKGSLVRLAKANISAEEQKEKEKYEALVNQLRLVLVDVLLPELRLERMLREEVHMYPTTTTKTATATLIFALCLMTFFLAFLLY